MQRSELENHSRGLGLRGKQGGGQGFALSPLGHCSLESVGEKGRGRSGNEQRDCLPLPHSWPCPSACNPFPETRELPLSCHLHSGPPLQLAAHTLLGPHPPSCPSPIQAPRDTEDWPQASHRAESRGPGMQGTLQSEAIPLPAYPPTGTFNAGGCSGGGANRTAPCAFAHGPRERQA